MKRIIFSLFVATLLVPSFVLAQNVKKGDTATVPGWEWVDVMNQEPVTQNFSNGTSQLGYGGTCGIKMGNTVTVIGIDINRVLVRYTAVGRPMGTQCPLGNSFLHHEGKVLQDDSGVQPNPCGQAERARPRQTASQEVSQQSLVQLDP